MRKVRNSNLLLVLAMAFVAMFSCLFGVATMNGAKAVTVSAETVDYTELLGLEDRTSWGAHANEYYFGGITLNQGYFNCAPSVCSAWHADNSAIISANNGVDIMKYIYVNGQCARDLIDVNYFSVNHSS